MERLSIRQGLKQRYTQPERRDRSRAPQRPRKGLEDRRERPEQQHLPFLDLHLPYSTEELALLLEDENPIIEADVRNNGNASSIMPFVELLTSPLRIDFPLPLFPHTYQFVFPSKTMGVASVGILYPHETRRLQVGWDWSRWPEADAAVERRWLAILFAAFCYDPILDPRPDPENISASQADFHRKVVTIRNLHD
jgi:hypothetical protein